MKDTLANGGLLRWVLGILQIAVIAFGGLLFKGQDRNTDLLNGLAKDASALQEQVKTQREEIILLRTRLNGHLSGYGELVRETVRLREDVERIRNLTEQHQKGKP